VEEKRARHVGLAGFAPDSVPEPLAYEVWDLLRIGSPKLAYGVATGFPMVPFDVNVVADFVDVATPVLPGQGNQNKIVWDMAVYEIAYQIQNKATPAAFDSQTNYFFELESGIEATLLVTGAAGGYTPVVNYTPLRLISGKLARPWLLTYNNGIVMSFQATVTLPFPVKVTVTFKSETCLWPALLDMTGSECLIRLREMGYMIDCFKTRCSP
jgi:hypothetical protein